MCNLSVRLSSVEKGVLAIMSCKLANIQAKVDKFAEETKLKVQSMEKTQQ